MLSSQIRFLAFLMFALTGTVWTEKISQAIPNELYPRTPETNSITAIQDQPIIPVMINRADVPLLWLNIKGSGELQAVTLDLNGTTTVSDMDSIKIFAVGKKRRVGLPDKAELFGQLKSPLTGSQKTITGKAEITSAKDNWFMVTLTLKSEANLLHHIGLRCSELTVSGQKIEPLGHSQPFLRLGYRVRHRGDDGSKGYRIPGLATSNKGTLLAVYDIRRDGRRDLQGDIDIGLSRSVDGGQTWLPMQVILDMGAFGGLPQKYNGVSDAGILVDRRTGRIFVFGCWMHGLRNPDGSFRNDLTINSTDWAHQWHGGKIGSGPGMSPRETAQFLMTYSDDDGQTWSKPMNITEHVKQPDWHLFCPAPGKGITADDGTLVMPVQGRDEIQQSFSTIMISRDHGKNWQVGSPAQHNTTESAVVQLQDGSIMLNMRASSNRSDKSHTNGRAVSITCDWGKSWQKHESDHRADLLPEPCCMASLIRTTHNKQSILLFSNPANRHDRTNMTIKASLDEGKTWPAEFQVELDSLGGAYSCLTGVDNKTIGILYESSQGYLIFQKISLDSIAKPFQASNKNETGQRLNVLFIAIDDLRAQMGCYGDENAVTPHMDRLARRGMVFQRAYCQQSVCNPSRASLMTGRYPDTIRVWDLDTHFRDNMPDIVTLPQHFKDHGYHTECIGKIYHDPPSARDSLSWSVPEKLDDTRSVRGKYVLPKNLKTYQPDGKMGKEKAAATECADVPDDAYIDGRVADKALERLRALSSQEQLFFLAIGFRRPHLPFSAPKKYWEMQKPDKIGRPANPLPPREVPPIALHNWKELRGYADMPRSGMLSDAHILRLRHGYYAAMSYVDAQIGKLLDELDRLDLRDRTLICLWGDHGWHLGEHGLWCKTTNFELDTRSPLIISAPGQTTTGQSTRSLVEFVDIYPTLVELCGLPAVRGLEGRSLVPILKNPAATVRQSALSQFPRPTFKTRDYMGYSIRTDRYRYTEWRHIKSGRITARELYDHNSDPAETVSLVPRDDYAGTVKVLHEKLSERIKK